MFIRETLAVYLDSNNEQAGNNTGYINTEVNGIHSNQCEQLWQPKTTINLSWNYTPFQFSSYFIISIYLLRSVY
jgi:hypothetical protein